MRGTSRQNARGYGAKRTKGGWLSRPARRAVGDAPAVQGTHRADLLPGRSKDTRGLAPQPDPAAVSAASSEQAAYRSLPRQRESSFAPLLLLSESQTLRWFAIRFWIHDRATAPCGDRTERAISNGDRASCRTGKIQEP